ncbi:response regulator [Actinoplanes flavus]|uniref:Response regulator transcription factor n=1 Tax=Actinoplanes flavus TaxID=2820290 RepID=A0ABS3UR03_9ACTN|nr:response regulator [Actinoplanes flavus]MBO3741204.1 response regulator transcription factor [Actinoplanes flavus]
MTSVLVVDDDPTLLRLIETVLHSAGLEVASRDTGEAALRAAHALPDCAVLGTGLDHSGALAAARLCRAIRADRCTADIPILLLTEQGRGLDAAAAFDAGADDCLARPFTAQDLLSRIETLTLSGKPFPVRATPPATASPPSRGSPRPPATQATGATAGLIRASGPLAADHVHQSQ